MKFKTHFSTHAYERVANRLSMSNSELAAIIDDDKFINIGEEPGHNRAHKLFYSKEDRMCFVAVQDIKIGTVITVLPIDYHNNIAWSVSMDSQHQAKQLIIPITQEALQAFSPPSQEQVVKDIIQQPQPSQIINFKIHAVIADEYGKFIKNITLGAWPCATYSHEIEKLVQDDNFREQLKGWIKEKNSEHKDKMEFVHTILIRVGSKATPKDFSAFDFI